MWTGYDKEMSFDTYMNNLPLCLINIQTIKMKGLIIYDTS